jgi:hypothetical protein
MFVPSEASVQMKIKVFNIFFMWERKLQKDGETET